MKTEDGAHGLRRRPVGGWLGLGLLLLGACATEPPRELTVFAAASLREGLEGCREAFEAQAGIPVRFHFAGSNVLARQIEATAGADVFLSADQVWLEELDQGGFLVKATRRSLWANRLVLIAHRRSLFVLKDPAQWHRLPFRFLALADPRGVPAGRYARAYLESLRGEKGSVWEAVKDRMAPAADVRGALALVVSDPEILGLVYRTDAATSDQVRILLEIPEAIDAGPQPQSGTAPPIRYGGAVVASSAQPELARTYLAFLQGPEAATSFETRGFLVLGKKTHD